MLKLSGKCQLSRMPRLGPWERGTTDFDEAEAVLVPGLRKDKGPPKRALSSSNACVAVQLFAVTLNSGW